MQDHMLLPSVFHFNKELFSFTMQFFLAQKKKTEEKVAYFTLNRPT